MPCGCENLYKAYRAKQTVLFMNVRRTGQPIRGFGAFTKVFASHGLNDCKLYTVA